MAAYLDELLPKLESFEGSIPWMYLDTRGHVTVGVGLMLPDVAAAQKLAFVVGTEPATEAEIATEFARVTALPMGRPAQFYHHPTSPVLPQAEIDSLLQTVVAGFDGELRDKITGYDGFPDNVKMALLDMAYNLGPYGLIHGFPTVVAAVESGNWARAAANCFRHGPGAARNQWTQQMFMGRVVGSITAEAEGSLKLLGYGLVGVTASAIDWIRRRR